MEMCFTIMAYELINVFQIWTVTDMLWICPVLVSLEELRLSSEKVERIPDSLFNFSRP